MLEKIKPLLLLGKRDSMNNAEGLSRRSSRLTRNMLR
jgi:hypothetical protein